MKSYSPTVKTGRLPRLPLEGHIDLTYRCNNHCLHCWLRIPEYQAGKELSFDEIRRIADQARAMGCRRWSISGGEPMLRPDFPEIFDYLTRRSTGYTLNSNGTLITPEIARLLTRKGVKMIALYGATADVYDSVTRHPGGFEKVMHGFSYLKEAGAGFVVQLIPMKANRHQWDDMVTLAKALSPQWRVGAAWLFLSSLGSSSRNREIIAQRLSPEDVIDLDKPDPAYEERMAETEPTCRESKGADDRLFAGCIAERREFHIDPYGGMTWCSFIKDPDLRFDLRRGAFRDAWDTFIPSCADKIRGGDEWRTHCGSCDKRRDCRWCAVYARLETGRYSAPVPYLCEIAEEAGRFKLRWREKHRRYFRIAGITVGLESDLDLSAIKFKDELRAFAVNGPGDDNVTLRHHFELPDLKNRDLGRELYRKPPWAIFRKNGTWFYLGISPTAGDNKLHRVAVFNADHTRAAIYSPAREKKMILANGWPSLSLFPTDQIWLGPLLADRHAVLLHSAAAIVNRRGLIFIGRSDAGKSTTMELLKKAGRDGREKTNRRNGRKLHVEILCDDRNIIRKWPEGWRIHGTWSHGTTPDVSPSSAPLSAILFLEQSRINEIVRIEDGKLIWRRLLATLIRPMVTAEWWRKELDILERLVDEAAFFTMRFDKSGAIVPELERLSFETRNGKRTP